ncbi:unnamed protein product, partial [Sphacelaria rigidula]
MVRSRTMQAKGSAFAAVLREDMVADAGRMAEHFGVLRRQVTLAGATFVEELTGFEVGTIPPLGHRVPLPILVDKEVLQFSTVIGGAGCSGFDSQLSVDDLLRATRADVIDFARPKMQSNGFSGRKGAPGGLASGRGYDEGVVPLENAPSDIRSPFSAATVKGTAYGANGVSSSGLDGWPRNPVEAASPITGPCTGEDLQSRIEMQSQISGIAAGIDTESIDSGRQTERERVKRGPYADADHTAAIDTGSLYADADHTATAGIESSAESSTTETKLRVIAAAMRTVAAALSALPSADPQNKNSTEKVQKKKDREIYVTDNGSSKDRPSLGSGDPEISSLSLHGSGEPMQAGRTDGRDGSFSGLSPAAYVTSVGANNLMHDGRTPAAEYEGVLKTEAATAVESAPATASIGETNGLRTGAEEMAETNEVTATTKGGTGAGGSAATAAGKFGEGLTRAAGTPTVDAIGGDVHLVAVVGGKRSLTRLLHFVDLVPPMEPLSVVTDQTCLVRKSWIGPATADGSPPRPVQVQLIMGKTLVTRLGEEEARVVMRGVKRGQLLYITGRPTPDTRRRFSRGATGDAEGGRENALPLTLKNGVNADTYDLVCCSVRLLEDAPTVEEALVGKGDDWEGEPGEYLRMDLPDSAVTYVDTAAGLKEMGGFLQE